MRIVAHNHDKLVLEVRPTWFPVIFWAGGALILLGVMNQWSELDTATACAMSGSGLAFLAASIYFLRPSIFDFDRISGTFRWTRPGLFKPSRGSVQLDLIQRVRVDKEYCDGDDCYQVLVETPSDKVPLLHGHMSGMRTQCQRTADLIEDWLTQ